MDNTIKKYKAVAENKKGQLRRRVRRSRWGCRFGCKDGLIELENEESVECPDCYYLKYRRANLKYRQPQVEYQANLDRGLDHYNDIFRQQNRSKAFNQCYPYKYKYPKKETNYISTLLWWAAIFLSFCILARAGGC